METTLNKTDFVFACVGTVSELNLKKEDSKRKINGGKEEVPCQVVRGAVALKTNNLVTTLNVYFSSVDYDGSGYYEGTEARQWNMAQAMLKWNPLINGNSNAPATRVRVKGEIAPNDYPSYKNKTAGYSLRYNIRSASTNVPDDVEDFFNINLKNGFVTKVAPEIVNDEETGRALIKMLGVTYNGEVFPIEITTDEDAGELILEGDSDFDAFEPAQTRSNLKMELVNAMGQQVEVKKPTKGRVIGKKARTGDDPSENNNSMYRSIMVLREIDPMQVEEPEEKTYTDEEGNEVAIDTMWLDPETIKAALKVRKEKVEALEAEAIKGKPQQNSAPTSGNSAFNSSKARAKAKATASAQKKKPIADPVPNGDPYDIDNIDF